MSIGEPFRQGRFEDLPEAPRIPHPYFDAEALEVVVSAPGWPPVRTHVRRFGAGPPLLLVHGLMTSGYSFRYVLEPLGARFTCYVPDLPSAGRSDAPLEPRYGPAALARFIGALQSALSIRGCPIVGNSMGGYLCMRLALDDPGAMSRLVNLHSPGIPEARLYALAAALAVPGSRRVLRWLVQRDVHRWAHANVHYYDETLKSLEEAREYASPLRTDAGVAGLAKYLGEALAPGPMRDLQRELALRRADGRGFPVPLLLMYAERDPMVPARFGARFSERIPDAQMVWLERASHFAHVDAVERFIPPTLDFLRSESSSREVPSTAS